MSTLGTEIAFYLNVVIDINKKIGGKRGYEAEASSKDKFLVLKDNISKDMQFVKVKLEEREKKTGADVLGINLQIKDKMEDIYNQIERLKQCVNQEKIDNPAAKDIKMQIADQLTEKAKKLEEMIEGIGDAINALTGGKKGKGTYTDNRALLLDHEGKNKGTYRVKSNKNKPPTEMELQTIDRWKKTDQDIDDKIDELTQQTIEWKKKAKQTGELIDQTDQKIQGLIDEVDQVNDNLLKSNKQLKGIVEKYRKPHKFCIDVVLVLVLIGLIVGIIKVAN